MKSELKDMKLVMPTTDAVPDGSYPGRWGGYHVTFQVGGRTFEAQSVIGVRGMNIPCTVTVVDCQATVHTASGSRSTL